MSNRASGDEAAAAEIAGFIEADKEAVCLVPFFEVGGAEAVGGLLPQTAIHGEPIDQGTQSSAPCLAPAAGAGSCLYRRCVHLKKAGLLGRFCLEKSTSS